MFKHLKKLWSNYKKSWIEKQAFKDLVDKIKGIFTMRKS